MVSLIWHSSTCWLCVLNGSLSEFPGCVSSSGITNYEEYSLIQEAVEEKKEDGHGTGTLKKDRTLLRDERKMERLKAKLHTDDDREFEKHFQKNTMCL
jgi:hypothetical protein